MKWSAENLPSLKLPILGVCVLGALVYPYASSVSGECRIVPYAAQKMRAPISGRVGSVLFAEGQRIKRGEVLLRFDDQALRKQLLAALIAQGNAERAITFAKERELLAAGNTMRATLRYWQDETERLRSALDFTVLRANIDGEVVAESLAELPHADVEQGQPLLDIVDTEQVLAEILLAERDIAEVAPEQKALVRVFTDATRSYDSVVQTIVPQAERGPLGTFIVVKARIDNHDQRLLAGTNGVAKIQGSRVSGFRRLARLFARLFGGAVLTQP